MIRRASFPLILATMLTLATVTLAHAQTGPCIPAKPIKPSLGGPVVERRVRHLVACATKRWHVQGGVTKALCIAHRESGPYMWPWADSGANKGTYQLNANYYPAWRSRYWDRHWRPRDPGYFNPRAGVIIAVRLAHAGGWSPWSTNGACS